MLFCKKNSIFVTRNEQHNNIKNMMTIEEYRAAILKALLDAKNDDELKDGILWNTPEDVAAIILEGV